MTKQIQDKIIPNPNRGHPEIPNHKYEYVCKIVEAVKLGIKQLNNESSEE